MNQCKQCGATLPEDSRFCLQCGTENKIPNDSGEGPQKELEFLMPALKGGLALGVLSSVPLINTLNVVCCLWAQAGGGLATWFLNKQRPGGLKYGDGAFVGVVSGLIGAFVGTIIGIPVQLFTFTPEVYSQMETGLAQAPPQLREFMLWIFTPGFDISRTLVFLVINLLSLGLFAMIGGIITTAILNRKKTD